jgi:hypothetical protein
MENTCETCKFRVRCILHRANRCNFVTARTRSHVHGAQGITGSNEFLSNRTSSRVLGCGLRSNSALDSPIAWRYAWYFVCACMVVMAMVVCADFLGSNAPLPPFTDKSAFVNFFPSLQMNVTWDCMWSVIYSDQGTLM